MAVKGKLNRKMKRFCEEYIQDHNKTQAYIRAGYSENGAGQGGERLFKKVEVAKYIAELEDAITAKLLEKYEVTADKIMRERAMIAFFRTNMLYDDKGNLLPPHLWPEEVAAVVSGVKTRAIGSSEAGDKSTLCVEDIKTHSKDSSLQALERIKGMYAEDNKQRRVFAEMKEDDLDAEIRELEEEAKRLGVQ